MSRVTSTCSWLAGLTAASLLLFSTPAAAAPTSASLKQGVDQGVQLLRARFRRADFMEDTPREIAQENECNPWQAWALAFFPTAIIKGVTLGLAFAKAKDSEWAVYLPLIPSMGISHFWETKVWWAGVIAIAGDLVGGSLVTYYFAQEYQATAVNPADKTLLWAGIGVLATFFLYENISAPVVAAWQNRRLRRQFMPTRSAALGPSWRQSPWADQARLALGPLLRLPPPVGASYSFKF